MGNERSPTISDLLERATVLFREMLDDTLRPKDMTRDEVVAELNRVMDRLRGHGTVRFALTL